MLREGRFILPLMTNDGHSNGEVAHMAVGQLAEQFGGATVTSSRGIWKAADGQIMDEAVYVLDVAYEASQANDQRLIAIATHAAIQAKQHSVYIRLGSGEVLIPDVRPHTLQEVA